MGICSSNAVTGGSSSSSLVSPPTEEEIRQSKLIDKILREDERRLAREVKMLLLGPGSSGKSTILKQMKVIHLAGFTPEEIETYRQQIFSNILTSMKQALELLDELDLCLKDSTIQFVGQEFLRSGLERELKEGERFPIDYYKPLQVLWEDPGIQTCVQRSNEATIPENTIYFYTSLHRLFLSPSAEGYKPTESDILRCRLKTVGINETCFTSRELRYRIFDVGGQRSERKKWIHCFESVTAVLFLAAVSGYDQCLLEDKDSNQMQEALMLFDSICNSQWFVRTSIILFLNKVDVFKERILVSSIKDYFPDYEGDDTNYNTAREYFKNRFTRLNRSQSKEIYTNYTTAIDTNLVKVVMASVYDIIVTRNLNDIIL